jgi:hypothetical protein
MLHFETPFPAAGSTAVYAGTHYRVLRHHHDGTVLLGEKGTTRASGQRTAPLADLLDPRIVEENASLTFMDEARATIRIALFVAGYLRAANEIPLRELGIALRAAADEGRIPLYRDNSHLVRIMRKLGWKKNGYAGEGFERSPLYRRRATAAQAA